MIRCVNCFAKSKLKDIDPNDLAKTLDDCEDPAHLKDQIDAGWVH